MFLSRLELNTRSGDVRRDLGDVQGMHRTLLRAFEQVDGPAREAAGLLYRVEAGRSGEIVVLAQSSVQPVWERLPDGYVQEVCEPKEIDEALAGVRAGMRLRFRLRANPTRKIDTKSGPNGERRNGKRVDLRTEEDQLAWLARKGEAAGFRLMSATVRGEAEGVGVPDVRTTAAARETGRRQGARLTFGAVQFDGALEVTDAEALRAAVAVGVGSGKAYGFGLLSLAPAE